MKSVTSWSFLAWVLSSTVAAVTISEINGNAYISPYKGQSVTGVEGLVTAKGKSGFYLRSTSPDTDDATSESIYVYGSSSVSKVTVGDIITLSGKISEYRSSSSYVYLTEISSPSSITIKSSGNDVTPVVIGQNRSPPTVQYSSLDGGDVLGLPNNASQISVANPSLQPELYGMDFWESLSGELVSLTGLTAITKPNSYGEFFVLGDWSSTGRNERGGLTMRANDSNPEAIKIGGPLDGTSNPKDTKLGDTLKDITGVIQYSYGVYMVLPLTAITVTGSNSTNALPTVLTSDGTCSAITVGDYNVNNLTPNSSTITGIADHITHYLRSPTIVCLQEIQDNNGATNNGVIDANLTLSTLASLIASAGGPNYNFIDIPPVDGQDGGQPGGNIRVAYLYNPSVVKLHNPNPGSSMDANEVLSGPALKYNPGLIAPSNAAWDSSRKPLAAAWETLDGKNILFTINVHFTSKGGGSSLQGDPRPPVNGGVSQRESQAELVAAFVSEILAKDSDSKVLVTGDFNEFSFTQPLKNFAEKSGLREIEDVVGLAATERYTYLYDSNCQQLDHMFISQGLTNGADIEHIHMNTWVSYGDQQSDHDPSVALLNICSGKC
ncbi:hypothetical protein P175DRAFT_0502598 [Aspergillus ochraceoroseus IBT 24754]|uniref:Endonuclease/exonuclease/phosphatase domain-containing protein n=2 Tax=Aspergillus ochraceoroseus TaxID=138278 RepID=A0A2T5LS41_9EURO|nr:uncharacterized protein P175DRAFT_0502598 [Aspergillus ochraceoroseus IBT 24754]KKK20318.1 hypothetical protein AOCH_002260 [Aspergillus ochraceoroseus]PTU19091.1 hypothetical protein P175DRAFT_0502598 [Aspergillus ochraceoroseus IBT 24754]